MENELPINSERVREPEPSSVAGLLNRRIDFHVARKPFNGFSSSSSNGFKLVTLNPNSGTHQASGSAKKSERSECLDSGFDSEMRLEITFRRIGAGLRNLGNTCFLNSVLQCLTYTEPLAAYLQSGKHQNSCRNAGFCALCAIQKHVSRALQSTGRILEPKDLVSNLRCISRNFRNARQEDAHEYMVHLLESMHKCCLPSGVPSESPSAYEKSLVHKIFGGRLRSQVKCMQCSFCSHKFDPFLDLSLEIAKADSLHKALCHFTAKEQLDGGAKQYQCQRCKQKVKALKQLTIHKAPHVLTVHLKRFGHVHGQKIDKKIAFDPTLDLKPFVSGSYEGDLTYTLYGVLVHAGWNTHSGHYYCFVRTSSGMWYSLDDNQVGQVSERKVLEQKAYILFYVRDRKNYFSKKQVDILKEENKIVNAIGKSTHLKPVLDSSVRVHNGSNENNSDVSSLTDALSLSDGRVSHAQENSFEKIFLHNANGKLVDDPLCHKRDPLSDVLPATPTKHQRKDPHMKINNAEHRAESSSTIEGNGDTLNSSKFVDCKNNVHAVQHPNLSTNSSVPKDPRSKKDSSGFVAIQSMSSRDKTKRTLSEPIDQLSNVKALGIECEGTIKTEDVNENAGDGKKICPSENANNPKALIQNNIQNKLVGVNLKTLDSTVEDPHGLLRVQSRSPELLVPTENLSHEIARNKKRRLKVKRKLFSRHPATMTLSSTIIFGAACSSRKKKRKAKKHRMQKTSHNQKDLSEGNDLPSNTGKSVCGESVSLSMDHSIHLRKKVKHGSDAKIISCNGTVSCDVVTNDLKVRVIHGSATLAAENQPQTKQSAAQQRDDSGLCRGQSSRNDVMSMLTRGLEETTVARWHDINVAISEKTETTVAEIAQIGYIGDAWDEEYDRGKQKKIRSNKVTFGGPNLFQEIASRNSGRKRAKVERGSLESPPFRI